MADKPGKSAKKQVSLWFTFSVIVFVILLSVFLVNGLVAYLLLKLNLLNFSAAMGQNGLGAILLLYGLSLLTAILFTGFFSHHIMMPIEELSRALLAVTKGDFSVRLEPNSRLEKLRVMTASFNTMAAHLASTETLRDDFVANVSHEFRTPLSAIEGYAMLLQDSSQTRQEQADCVEKILNNVDRLSSLAENILLLSKLENQSILGGSAVFRLDEQIRQAILALESQWSEKNIEFDLDLASVKYTGNSQLLYLIWTNLIGNAVKFSPPGSEVAVILHETDGTISCSVLDHGEGMSPETLDHIFEKFYQGDSSHHSQGNGLGLALVRRIVAILGGTIAVDSHLGGGSHFVVTFPRQID